MSADRAGRAGSRTGGTERVAVLERRGKFLVAEPFFQRGPRLAVSRDSRAMPGDLVLVRAGGGGRRGGHGAGRASVVRRIGRPDVACDVIQALMLDRGLRRAFDPAVEHEARASAGAPIELTGRRDLRELATFTIDPATARDFDDAISAADEGGDRWRVWVHIADVSAYVPARSLVDREAYRRGTSVYVPGAVEPMLPSELSNQACSLVPGEERLAVTVEMLISGQEVRRAAFYRSVIRSDARLDYERVDRVFAGAEKASEPWGEPLAAARAAAAALGLRRAARGALVLQSREPEFQFDDEGQVVGLQSVAQTESHRLIEHLMIAANEQVAEHLESRHVPALFRVHEPPDGPAVERLIDQLSSLGVPTPPVPGGHFTPQQAADLVGETSQLVDDWVQRTGRGRRALTRLVLRSLKQAYYDPRSIGHSGLRSPLYCHFTSPIRRYPDLVCHRALLSTLGSPDAPPARLWVASAAEWSSAREREAMTIERDADDVARSFLLERRLRELGRETVFEGEVVGVIGAGAFVAFGEGEFGAVAAGAAGLAGGSGVAGVAAASAVGDFEGMLPVRRLRGEWWELNEQGTALIGSRSGRALRLGDPVRVEVGRVEAARGRVDLLPAADES